MTRRASPQSRTAPTSRARGADSHESLSATGRRLSDHPANGSARATYLKHEVSDGVHRTPPTPTRALEILRARRLAGQRGSRSTRATCAHRSRTKDPPLFGPSRYEQGHNFFKIDRDLISTIVTKNKDVPEQAKIDMIVSLITLKYTQSNSVCYVKTARPSGGSRQQSRVHCTRLAGNKADTWYLRQHPKARPQFVDGIRRANRDNAIDVYISTSTMTCWPRESGRSGLPRSPRSSPERRTAGCHADRRHAGSDAFFPFGDNVERAHKSGVSYIAEPGGSIRDDNVIETAASHGLWPWRSRAMRLFLSLETGTKKDLDIGWAPSGVLGLFWEELCSWSRLSRHANSTRIKLLLSYYIILFYGHHVGHDRHILPSRVKTAPQRERIHL